MRTSKIILVLMVATLAFVAAACGSEATIIQTETDGDTEAVADGDADSEAAPDGDQNEGEQLADGDTEAESEATEGEAEKENEAEQELTCDATACAIAGTCYADKALDPESPCRRCDISTSKTTWTNLAFGTTCNDGNACTKEDKCDGQGACKGTPDAACQADGDAEYDPDIDPDEVKIGEKCPEQGLAICLGQVAAYCNGSLGWAIAVNCAEDGNVCWQNTCVNPSTATDYPGCIHGETRCVGTINQYCDGNKVWNTSVDCSSDGNKCYLGECIKP